METIVEYHTFTDIALDIVYFLYLVFLNIKETHVFILSQQSAVKKSTRLPFFCFKEGASIFLQHS